MWLSMSPGAKIHKRGLVFKRLAPEKDRKSHVLEQACHRPITSRKNATRRSVSAVGCFQSGHGLNLSEVFPALRFSPFPSFLSLFPRQMTARHFATGYFDKRPSGLATFSVCLWPAKHAMFLLNVATSVRFACILHALKNSAGNYDQKITERLRTGVHTTSNVELYFLNSKKKDIQRWHW